jgi:hypothetical protein
MQPSLRHYAVIRRSKRAKWGSIWQVRDRRLADSNQLLIHPSRLIAWPILLARTAELHPVPLRLRSGKVVLVYGNDVQLDNLLQAIKQRKRSVRLDPISGFIEQPWKLPKSFLPSVICLLLLVFYALSTQSISQPVQASAKINKTCQEEPLENSMISKADLQARTMQIASTVFKITLRHSLGGLTFVTLRRTCDGSLFRYRAWLSNHGLSLGSRY